jgi:hypothetical protein
VRRVLLVRRPLLEVEDEEERVRAELFEDGRVVEDRRRDLKKGGKKYSGSSKHQAGAQRLFGTTRVDRGLLMKELEG